MATLSSVVQAPELFTPPAATDVADHVVERHRQGKLRRRLRDLTAEKFAVHLDGQNDGQWADIINSQAVQVPPRVGGALRLQRNLLRPLVANTVSYHTSIPFRVVAQAAADRESRQRAKVDTLFANHLIRHQRLNQVFAEAMQVACVYGSCPVHASWRDDLSSDPYEPLYNTNQDLAQKVRRGFIDCWVGDPWDTVYNDGATRNSLHRMSYGRTLPLEYVQQAFAHVEGIEKLKGRKDLPSAARFQRISRRWVNLGGTINGGTSAILSGGDGEEIVALICEETAPGIDRNYPDGRLVIVALSGAATTDRADSGGTGGTPILLHDGPLPGKRISCVRVYSLTDNLDDILGKPYVADLDDLQTQINQLATLRAERIRRYARPQLVAEAGGIEDDTAVTRDDAIIYVTGGRDPYFLDPPGSGTADIDSAINETLDQMFRIGGWQAASRGEGSAGDAAAKVVALSKADDSIFGPINRHFQQTVCDFLALCHALAKEYMDVPWLLDITGTEQGFLAQPYISRDDLSEAPQYLMVSGYGTTPEAIGQQLMDLVGIQGADGIPLLSTRQFWDLWPDHSIRPLTGDTERIREARAHTINAAIQLAVDGLRGSNPELDQMPPEMAQTALLDIHDQLMAQFPVRRTDDPQYHVDTLDELVQDEMADPLVRQLAELRQEIYFQWLEDIFAAQTAAQPGMEGESGAPAQGGGSPGAAGGGDPFGGAAPGQSMPSQNLMGEVNGLTQEAYAT